MNIKSLISAHLWSRATAGRALLTFLSFLDYWNLSELMPVTITSQIFNASSWRWCGKRQPFCPLTFDLIFILTGLYLHALTRCSLQTPHWYFHGFTHLHLVGILVTGTRGALGQWFLILVPVYSSSKHSPSLTILYRDQQNQVCSLDRELLPPLFLKLMVVLFPKKVVE